MDLFDAKVWMEARCICNKGKGKFLLNPLCKTEKLGACLICKKKRNLFPCFIHPLYITTVNFGTYKNKVLMVLGSLERRKEYMDVLLDGDGKNQMITQVELPGFSQKDSLEVTWTSKKICNRCLVEKPTSEFYIHHGRKNPFYNYSACKSCSNARSHIWRKSNSERYLVMKRKSYVKNKDKIKARRALNPQWRRESKWKLLGIKNGDGSKFLYSNFMALMKSQNELCAICLIHIDSQNKCSFHVDHCHKTGKIRGLLCDKCNRGLGNFRDSQEFLKKAMQYLVGY